MDSIFTSMYVKFEAGIWGFDDNNDWCKFNANELNHKQLSTSNVICIGYTCT